VTIVKKVTKSTYGGAVKFGGGRVYIKFPQWAVGNWVMFDIHQGEEVRQVKFLNSKDYRDILLDVKGKPMVYNKNLSSGIWKLSCPKQDLPEEIRAYSRKLKQDQRPKAENNSAKKQTEAKRQEKINQTAIYFMDNIAGLFAPNDRKTLSSLYVNAVNKGFTLSDQADQNDLIDLIRFASTYSLIKDSEILRLKNVLLPKISFLNKAKLILSEKEYTIFVKMFGQIRNIYLEYRQGDYGREEVLFKVESGLIAWRAEFSNQSEPMIEEKVFINSLVIRIVRIFFQNLKASYGQVQDKLKQFDLDLLTLNDSEFQSSLENWAQVKKLNDQLLAMGWEMRFMKNKYEPGKSMGEAEGKPRGRIKPSADFMSVDKMIDIQNFFIKNNIDFLALRKGLVKNIPAKVSEKFEEEFGLVVNGFIYQHIIVNLRMLEQNERKVAADIFGFWIENLKGFNYELAKSKKEEVELELNSIFEKGFPVNQEDLIKNFNKDLAGALQTKMNIEQAI